MKSLRAIRRLAALCGVTLLWLPAALRAQEPGESSSKHPAEEIEKGAKPTPAKPLLPRFDPLRAEKDIEVGSYYLRKGNVDAAIDRFQDAIEARPNYALPHRLLGEAQERKGLKREAIQSFRKYLEIYPKAEDAQKIRKRIEKLEAARERNKE